MKTSAVTRKYHIEAKWNKPERAGSIYLVLDLGQGFVRHVTLDMYTDYVSLKRGFTHYKDLLTSGLSERQLKA